MREKGKTDGAFLIESGILSVGVELDGKKTKVRPLFAKQWYAKLGDSDKGAKTGAGGSSRPQLFFFAHACANPSWQALL